MLFTMVHDVVDHSIFWQKIVISVIFLKRIIMTLVKDFFRGLIFLVLFVLVIPFLPIIILIMVGKELREDADFEKKLQKTREKDLELIKLLKKRSEWEKEKKELSEELNMPSDKVSEKIVEMDKKI